MWRWIYAKGKSTALGIFCGSSNRLVRSAGYFGFDRTAAALASAGTAQFMVITSKHHFRIFMSAMAIVGFFAEKGTFSSEQFVYVSNYIGWIGNIYFTFKLIEETEETFNEGGIETVVVNDNPLIHIE